MRASVKRARRTPEEARRLILETAQQLIARAGPEGLRLQEIAAAAGISHPLILHHFGSREGLVRALTQQAVAELRDKLIAAMGSADYSLEQQLDQVFDAFRDGLAQRLAWLATIDPVGEQAGAATIMRDIADSLHARRVATAPPGVVPERGDTESLVHLIAAAAFGGDGRSRAAFSHLVRRVDPRIFGTAVTAKSRLHRHWPRQPSLGHISRCSRDA